jgi:D-3-phosphoglycerate dehydrogenase
VSAPTVVIATAPTMRRWAAVPGSPLAGRAAVREVHWSADEDQAAYAARFDAALTGADALVVSPWSWPCVPSFTPGRWAVADRLRVVAGSLDHRWAGIVELSEAAGRGVTVVDTSRTMTPTVAEYALAMTLNLLRDIPAAVQLARDGGWRGETWERGQVTGDLTGRRVGLAGYGSINRRYAELLGPFRCDIAAYDPHAEMTGIARAASLPALAARSEILVIGVPPSPATRGVVSARVIDALPAGALVVLVTRMAVVDQAALWRRAEAGGIRVAADVFEPEPPSAGASFLRSPDVLPTPHIAGATSACLRRCFTSACADALAVLDGRAPAHALTPRDDRLRRA